jgi:hypothetical protein
MIIEADYDARFNSSIENTNSNGEVFFELYNSTEVPNLILGAICEIENKTGKSLCFPFNFILFGGNEEISIGYKGYFFNATDRKFSFSFEDSDNDLEYCSHYIMDKQGELITWYYQSFQKPPKKCGYSFKLNETVLTPGVYWYQVLGYDGIAQTTWLVPLYVEEITISNPYSESATGCFEILGEDCYFLNGEKNYCTPYSANENKTFPIICPNKDSPTNPTLKGNFIKKRFIDFLKLVRLISIALITASIFYLLNNPNSRKKKLTITILFFSGLVLVISQLLLEFFMV